MYTQCHCNIAVCFITNRPSSANALKCEFDAAMRIKIPIKGNTFRTHLMCIARIKCAFDAVMHITCVMNVLPFMRIKCTLMCIALLGHTPHRQFMSWVRNELDNAEEPFAAGSLEPVAISAITGRNNLNELMDFFVKLGSC